MSKITWFTGLFFICIVLADIFPAGMYFFSILGGILLFMIDKIANQIEYRK